MILTKENLMLLSYKEVGEVMLTEEAIEQLARGINPVDVLKYIEEHKEDYEKFLKEEDMKGNEESESKSN